MPKNIPWHWCHSKRTSFTSRSIHSNANSASQFHFIFIFFITRVCHGIWFCQPNEFSISCQWNEYHVPIQIWIYSLCFDFLDHAAFNPHWYYWGGCRSRCMHVFVCMPYAGWITAVFKFAELCGNLPAVYQSGTEKNPISTLLFNNIQVNGTSPPPSNLNSLTERYSGLLVFVYLIICFHSSLYICTLPFWPQSLFTSSSIFRMLF